MGCVKSKSQRLGFIALILHTIQQNPAFLVRLNLPLVVPSTLARSGTSPVAKLRTFHSYTWHGIRLAVMINADRHRYECRLQAPANKSRGASIEFRLRFELVQALFLHMSCGLLSRQGKHALTTDKEKL